MLFRIIAAGFCPLLQAYAAYKPRTLDQVEILVVAMRKIYILIGIIVGHVFS